MNERNVCVPEEVRQKAVALGDEGQKWLDHLGYRLDELERGWGVAVGNTLGGGSASYVAAARTSSGEDVVVKLEMPPYESFAGEVRTLAAAGGRGYVRLLDHDEKRHAMLQERLGTSLDGSGLSVSTQIEILCATLQCAWEVPAPAGLQTGAEKARWLTKFIVEMWDELGQPCSQRVVEQAIAFAERREAAFEPGAAVLVHGDAHAANALQDLACGPGRVQFKLVDPDGLLAEPAYDLAISMREWSEDLLAGDTAQLGRERCANLSRLTGVDPQPIWEWGFVERVSTGLFVTQLGDARLGREMLDVAEAWVNS